MSRQLAFKKTLLGGVICPTSGGVYNASHIKRYGYDCPYKHVVFKWPAQSGARYTLISDSICKFICRTKHIYVQAFPGTTLNNILWDIRLGKVKLDNFDIIVVHVGRMI